MNEPTIKPGTRCECSGCPNCGEDDSYAVRMVTVRGPGRFVGVDGATGRYITDNQLPMCAACADWHERKTP